MKTRNISITSKASTQSTGTILAAPRCRHPYILFLLLVLMSMVPGLRAGDLSIADAEKLLRDGLAVEDKAVLQRFDRVIATCQSISLAKDLDERQRAFAKSGAVYPLTSYWLAPDASAINKDDLDALADAVHVRQAKAAKLSRELSSRITDHTQDLIQQRHFDEAKAETDRIAAFIVKPPLDMLLAPGQKWRFNGKMTRSIKSVRQEAELKQVQTEVTCECLAVEDGTVRLMVTALVLGEPSVSRRLSGKFNRERTEVDEFKRPSDGELSVLGLENDKYGRLTMQLKIPLSVSPLAKFVSGSSAFVSDLIYLTLDK